ncbi:hypothetical protein [Blastococcus mobilis]|uniref:Uncharacterized protein n=1 Tax=Blastococcus mobilis TaxID=1938746 RepID=A0A238VB38_9ACTN|nr:hypothetical protein [Blastococcus mobilis]SNR30759.1 hypothetical protein SAMN06272737_102233 [Blastococcus mobilis]
MSTGHPFAWDRRGRAQAWLAAGVVAALLVWWWMLAPFWQRARNTLDRPDD